MITRRIWNSRVWEWFARSFVLWCPSLVRSAVCTPWLTLWGTDHFTKQNGVVKTILQNKNPESIRDRLRHTPAEQWPAPPDRRPRGLSTRQCCPQHSYTALEMFPLLIMDCKFESVITQCYLTAALGSRAPRLCSPSPHPVRALCRTLIM